MEEQRMVYIVTAGEYSSYGIVGVFDNKATATRFAEQQNQKRRHIHYDVEEYRLNTDIPESITKYSVHIDMDGNELRRWEESYIPVEDYPGPDEAEHHEATLSGTRMEVVTAVSTKSYNAALQCAQDKLAEIKGG